MARKIFAAVAALLAGAGLAFAAGDWSVTLEGFDSGKKVAVIKAVRTATGLGLSDSKKLVESAPRLVKDNLSEVEADKIAADITAAGGRTSKSGPAGTGATAGTAAADARWSVTLESFGANKVAVIKVVRAATGMGLADSKRLVEAAPTLVKGGLLEADAAKLVSDLTAAGAKASKKSVAQINVKPGNWAVYTHDYPEDGIGRLVAALRAAGCAEVADRMAEKGEEILKKGAYYYINDIDEDSAKAICELFKENGQSIARAEEQEVSVRRGGGRKPPEPRN